jgi:hypothetical protein
MVVLRADVARLPGRGWIAIPELDQDKARVVPAPGKFTNTLKRQRFASRRIANQAPPLVEKTKYW